MKPQGYRLFTISFLVALILGPVAALFWQAHWGWLYANWIAYPFVFVCLSLGIAINRQLPRIAWIGLTAALMYVVTLWLNGGDCGSLLRLIVAVIPLLFLTEIREQISENGFRNFWRAFLVVLLIPVGASVLQLLGEIPYYDSGMAYDLYPGRISGGYMKPNNLNAILFPAYLFGIFLVYKGAKWWGVSLSGVVFIIVLVGGLRTSVVAYFVVLILALVPRFSNAVIYRAFRYCIFIVVGISLFLLLGQVLQTFGTQKGLRFRLPMWMIQSDYFFHSSPMQILFGKGTVQLPEEARKYGIASLSEAHNNGIRMVVTFGITGLILYGLLLRKVAMQIYASACTDQLKFLHFACLIHVLLYSITNEPAFFPGVFWPLTAWIFFTTEPANYTFKA